jgi:high potential iron-sulfur protein
MTDTRNSQRSPVSRRTILLRGIVYTAGAATLLGPASSAKADKMTKTVVGYQNSPNGNQQCSNCGQFEPPNACKFVEGDISTTAWCKVWTPKT